MNQIKKIRLLCVGKFSKIYLASSNKFGEVVLKGFNNKLNDDVIKSVIQNELEVLKAVDSKYIVKIYALYNTSAMNYFVLEYCDQGNIYTTIESLARKKSYLPESILLNWLYQMLKGLLVIHSFGYIHRNIEPSNILIKSILKNHSNIKYIDFKCAYKFYSNDEYNVTNDFIGIPLYMAPEIFNNEYYNYKVDIWSLGITLYELCTLRHPYNYDTINLIHEHIMTDDLPKLPRFYNKEIYNIIKSMCLINNKSRSNIQDILQNNIFSQFKNSPGIYILRQAQTQNSSKNPYINRIKKKNVKTGTNSKNKSKDNLRSASSNEPSKQLRSKSINDRGNKINPKKTSQYIQKKINFRDFDNEFKEMNFPKGSKPCSSQNDIRLKSHSTNKLGYNQRNNLSVIIEDPNEYSPTPIDSHNFSSLNVPCIGELKKNDRLSFNFNRNTTENHKINRNTPSENVSGQSVMHEYKLLSNRIGIDPDFSQTDVIMNRNNNIIDDISQLSGANVHNYKSYGGYNLNL